MTASRLPPPAGAWGTLAIPAAALGAMALWVGMGGRFAFDAPILEGLAGLRSTWLDTVFATVTWLGSLYLVLPATLAGMALLVRAQRRPEAALLGVGLGGAVVTTQALKHLLARERPAPLSPVMEPPLDPAFPSGHTAQAAVFALCLWLVLRRLRPGWRHPGGVVLGSAVALVAVSRLYLQVHWPSDVLGAILVAWVWAGAARALTDRGGRHQK
jgi:undecaprenyl-diphosphatase